MTRIKLSYLNAGYEFECAGHAGYAEKGKDIVCAGISALCMALTHRLSELADECVATIEEYHVSDGELVLRFSPLDGKADELIIENMLDTVMAGFRALEWEYPEYVFVE